ncbi:MAG: thioredoxin family protein [Arachidicoccus sp.]|nr:thioredoxin family protein [Arachidicoccus sp.]
MKKIILSLIILFYAFATANAQSTPETADEIVNSALSQAKQEHKKVLIMFHASWCGWCKKMDACLNDVSCKNYFNKNFVISHIDVFETKEKVSEENSGGKDLYAKYGGEEQDGIPFWLILDENGNLLANSKYDPDNSGKLQNIGCPAEEKEVAYFVSLLKKYTNISEADQTAVQIRFRKNKEKASNASFE